MYYLIYFLKGSSSYRYQVDQQSLISILNSNLPIVVLEFGERDFGYDLISVEPSKVL